MSQLYPTGLFSPLTNDDRFSELKLTAAVQMLRQAYREQGFFDVRVSPIKQLSGRTVRLQFVIEEGKRYLIDKISFTKDFPVEWRTILQERFNLAKQQPLVRDNVRSAERYLTREFRDQGSAFSQVQADVKIIKPGHVGVYFSVIKSPVYQVRFIHFVGNNKTKDSTLRHFFQLSEGDRYAQTQIDRAMADLQSVTYLQSVDYDVVVVDKVKKLVDIRVNVQEKSSSTISLRASYDASRGLIFTTNFVDRNFLGSGQVFSLSLERELNGREHYAVSWDMPRAWFNSAWSQTLDFGYYKQPVFQTSDDKDAQVPKAESSEVYFGARHHIPISASLRYNPGLKWISRKLVPGTQNSSPYSFVETFGDHITDLQWQNGFDYHFGDSRSLGGFWTLTFNTDLSLDTKWAGSVLKSGTRVEGNMVLMDWSEGQPILFNPVIRFGTLRGFGQYAQHLPYYHYFSMVGDMVVRGYDPYHTGPYKTYIDAKNIKREEFLGMTSYAGINLNLWLPSTAPDMYVPGLYVDAYSLHGEDTDADGLRSSAGLALKFNSPMGPIMVAYALSTLSNYPTDEAQRLWFSMSSSL